MRRYLAILAAALALALAVPETAPAGRRPRRAQVVERVLERHASFEDEVRRSIARALVEAEREHGVDSLLLVAVMERESRFRLDARSHRGAVGLMQIRPHRSTRLARQIGLHSFRANRLAEPATNIRFAAAYLAYLGRMFGRWDVALTAYNVGPTRVRRLIRADQRPVNAYARAVLQRWREIERTRLA